MSKSGLPACFLSWISPFPVWKQLFSHAKESWENGVLVGICHHLQYVGFWPPSQKIIMRTKEDHLQIFVHCELWKSVVLIRIEFCVTLF